MGRGGEREGSGEEALEGGGGGEKSVPLLPPVDSSALSP